MNYIDKDKKYANIIENIMENEEFLKIDDCPHHGITRLEHSLRVSYFSYKISKKMRLNVEQTTEAALLHDFFIKDDLTKGKQKLSVFYHPKKCLENANKHFELTDLQQDIIYSHMFPLTPTRPPKYMESWIVSFVDKGVAIYEFIKSYYKTFFIKAEHISLLLTLIMIRI